MKEEIKTQFRTLVRRGGSLGINLPTDWLKEMGWTAGNTLVLMLRDKEIVLAKVKSVGTKDGRTIELDVEVTE
jgi:antitoxin component of MazEF toxin-antitoxin module